LNLPPTFIDISGFAMRMGAKLAVNASEVTATGTDQVPKSGPVILAVRHYHNHLDGLGLLAQSRRPLHIMIGLDWVSTRRARWLMETLARGCAWPVTLRAGEGGKDDASLTAAATSAYRPDEVRPYQYRAFRQCVELLGQERVVVIFPEAYPLIDPHAVRKPRQDLLAPFKSGFARAAVTAARRHDRSVSVVPVGIRADAANQRKLAFAYGPPRLVTAKCDAEALVAHVKADIHRLSQ
jgi:1-acyl-sn-glycerol-3-phosphate acyltransferase